MRTAFTRAGVDALELSTDEDLVNTLLRFVELRRQRSRLAAGGGMPTHLKPMSPAEGAHELRVA